MPGVEFSESCPPGPEFSTGSAVSSPEAEQLAISNWQLAKPEPKPWYLLRTKSGQEKRAVDALSKWGVAENHQPETLLPLFSEMRQRFGRQPAEVHCPLFPGYLFSRFDPRFIPKAEITYGVIGLVRFGVNLAVVEDSLIEAIRAQLDPAGVLLPVAAPAPLEFRRGDRVRVTAGPFKDREGIFDCRLTANHRVQILLSTVAAGPSWNSGQRKPVQSERFSGTHGFSARVKLNLGELEKIG